jgi:peptidyl-prolyl cis-trans isomerase C
VLGACTGRDVVAKVDGTKLHQADLAAYRGARGRDPKEALGELVDRTLLAQAARKAGVDDDPTVRARVRAAEREILAQAYAERELGGATSEEKLRKRYSEEKERLVRKEIHVAHIAVQIVQRDPSSRVAAQSKASRIYSRITGGEPFEKVARDLSDDPVSKGRGGDLGPIREGQVDSRFFDAAAALKRGEVSKPFESAFGFHVVKALEDARTVTPSFEEVRGVLAAEARVAAEASLLGSLREKASVKLYPERLQTSEAKPDHSKGDAR